MTPLGMAKLKSKSTMDVRWTRDEIAPPVTWKIDYGRGLDVLVGQERLNVIKK